MGFSPNGLRKKRRFSGERIFFEKSDINCEPLTGGFKRWQGKNLSVIIGGETGQGVFPGKELTMADKSSNMNDQGFQAITADALMQTDPMNYDQNVSCQAIASALVKRRSGAITIVDQERKPVGIVTEYDLLRVIKEGKDLNQITPQAIMTQPIVISEKSLISEILDTLVTGHIIHLPVVDFQERLVGLIERQEILSAYLKYRK